MFYDYKKYGGRCRFSGSVFIISFFKLVVLKLDQIKFTMAEAAVEDRPSQKFYCHMCNVQFQNASAVNNTISRWLSFTIFFTHLFVEFHVPPLLGWFYRRTTRGPREYRIREL